MGKDGLIYFIGEMPDGFIKIGWVEIDIYRRLKELQSGNARPLTLHAYRRGTLMDEHILHEVYKDLRELGEWFRSAPALWVEMGREGTRGYDERIVRHPGKLRKLVSQDRDTPPRHEKAAQNLLPLRNRSVGPSAEDEPQKTLEELDAESILIDSILGS